MISAAATFCGRNQVRGQDFSVAAAGLEEVHQRL